MPFAYSTVERDIVEFYSALYDILWTELAWDPDPLIIDLSKSDKVNVVEKSNLVSKNGCWVTFSQDADNIRTIGFYIIGIKLNKETGRREYFMEGNTYEAEGLKIIEQAHHKDNQIHQYRDRMYIEYGLNDEHRPDKGYCFYKFREVGLDLSVTGFYTNRESFENLFIYGCKLDDDNHCKVIRKAISSKPVRIDDGLRGVFDEYLDKIPLLFMGDTGGVDYKRMTAAIEKYKDSKSLPDT